MIIHRSPENSPPQLSSAARRALETYIDAAGERAPHDIRAHTKRVIATLALYAPESFSDRAYDAAALHQLAPYIFDRNNPQREAAAMAVVDYFTNPDYPRELKENNYVGTLIGDRPYIDQTADEYQVRLRQHGHANLLIDGAPISAGDWLNLRVGANIPEIDRMFTTTNVEAHLGYAATLVDRIYSASDGDYQLFHDVLRTETMVVPSLDIYGLHAFAMMAQSNASKTRVIGSGNEATLDRAIALLDTAKKIDVEYIMKEFFGKAPQDHLFRTAEESVHGEQIVFSTTELCELGAPVTGELHARFKTAGKYALKMLRNPDYKDKLPADVFGMLAVVPDAASLGKFFDQTLQQIATRNDRIKLVVASSKQSPLYIQGNAEYRRQVLENVSSNVRMLIQEDTRFETTPQDKAFQVAKFTCELKVGSEWLPIEFQFQTKRDRKNARLGAVSHMYHDSGEGLASMIPGDPGVLHRMYARAAKIDSRGEYVNGQSIPHGVELERHLREVLDQAA